MGLDTPVVLAVKHENSFKENKANATNSPPGKYFRKDETQRNRRDWYQAVEHDVQCDSTRKTLPVVEVKYN